MHILACALRKASPPAAPAPPRADERLFLHSRLILPQLRYFAEKVLEDALEDALKDALEDALSFQPLVSNG